MVCHKPNPLNPHPTGQRICYQPGHSAFALKALCSGDDCVASGLFPYHTGCDEYIGTFHAVDGDCCTFNAGRAEYSDNQVTDCIEYNQTFINSTENNYHCINRNTCYATNSTADDSEHERVLSIENVDDGEGGSDPIGGTATYHAPHRLGIACGSEIGAWS